MGQQPAGPVGATGDDQTQDEIGEMLDALVCPSLEACFDRSSLFFLTRFTVVLYLTKKRQVFDPCSYFEDSPLIIYLSFHSMK